MADISRDFLGLLRTKDQRLQESSNYSSINPRRWRDTWPNVDILGHEVRLEMGAIYYKKKIQAKKVKLD